ncbi:CCA tRNA nucleotidyltransferase [Halopenitus sp. H-Gu1]|uniref:CCA tRNA nucleotidyltransferase n=1 Tax=Halopenitus sp. H-Gu1 TaxID=3242697 RepID=UPI00359D45D1
MSDLDAVRKEVLDRVKPDPEERARLQEISDRLVDRVHEALEELSVDPEIQSDVDVVRVGSTARGTWLAGDRDIDLFVRFPPDLPRADLERYGLAVGHAVLPEGHEEYAEHPYVKGTVDGFEVDLVPCYAVEDATAIRSAVDRTPFHDAYLSERLTPELTDAVLLAKRFLKGIGAYGSDLKTRGFSGYLTELLVVEFGGFEPLVRAAADWRPPVTIDPESHAEATFEDPLVVIDPTDPERNVAAVCSGENLARFQHYARDLLETPRLEVFFPPDRDPLDADAVREHLRRRGTTPVAVVFDAPSLVADQLWPQLRKSRTGIVRALDDRGFPVLRSTAMIETESGSGPTRAVLFVELLVETLPVIARHRGPPVAVREHAEGFYAAYADEERPPYGPFLEGSRYVLEREREVTSAAEFLASDALFDVGLGTHVADALEDREILVGTETATLADGFGDDLRSYFDPRP